MGPDDLVTVLEKVDLFHGLDRKVLRRMAEAGRQEAFEPGQTVLAQGEEVGGFRSFSPKGVEMHVVLTGSAEASVDGQVHGTLGPGDYFGELSLIDGCPRSASVIACEAMKTWSIAEWNFRPLLKAEGSIAYKLLVKVIERFRAVQRTATWQ